MRIEEQVKGNETSFLLFSCSVIESSWQVWQLM